MNNHPQCREVDKEIAMEKESRSEICRCPWVDLSKPDYIEYHDTEWGVPVFDDRTIFEFLTLEAAQASLSWYTVLRRRAGIWKMTPKRSWSACCAGMKSEKIRK